MTSRLDDAGRSDRVAPFVCLHGLAASSRWWRPVVDGLARVGPAHLLDFPRSLSPADLPEWVAAALHREGPANLVGHSLGALIAAQVAAAKPEFVRRLILIAPPGLEPGRSVLRYGTPLMRSLARSRPRLLWRVGVDSLRAGPRNIIRGGTYVAAADLTSIAGRVDVPTLLIWGGGDRLVTRSGAQRWLEAIPGARATVIERASHVPMVEAPSELVAAITDFCHEL